MKTQIFLQNTFIFHGKTGSYFIKEFQKIQNKNTRAPTSPLPYKMTSWHYNRTSKPFQRYFASKCHSLWKWRKKYVTVSYPYAAGPAVRCGPTLIPALFKTFGTNIGCWTISIDSYANLFMVVVQRSSTRMFHFLLLAYSVCFDGLVLNRITSFYIPIPDAWIAHGNSKYSPIINFEYCDYRLVSSMDSITYILWWAC